MQNSYHVIVTTVCCGFTILWRRAVFVRTVFLARVGTVFMKESSAKSPCYDGISSLVDECHTYFAVFRHSTRQRVFSISSISLFRRIHLRILILFIN